MSRIAIVLFNLGGPDAPEAVEPFLFNLFNDKAIIDLPQPLRRLVARLIARRRGGLAREIYAKIGGASPLLANTRAQSAALEAELADLGELRCFVAMRYWKPLTEEAATAVRRYEPARILLLPLYPQFSTTTTASAWRAWQKAAKAAGIAAPTSMVCCYPRQRGFVEAVAALVLPALAEASRSGKPRLLFSAHGLPKRVVMRGDPYQWQVEQSCAAVAAALGQPELDWQICYQSRVGPLEWIGPATDAAIREAGRERRPVVVAPIAFVSEHSETLVELDIEYRALAERSGVPDYRRVPTVSVAESFIAGLAALLRETLTGREALRSGEGGRICPAAWKGCPLTEARP